MLLIVKYKKYKSQGKLGENLKNQLLKSGGFFIRRKAQKIRRLCKAAKEMYLKLFNIKSEPRL